MKNTTKRTLHLTGIAAIAIASLSASGGVLADNYRHGQRLEAGRHEGLHEQRYEKRYEPSSRFAHGYRGREVLVVHYVERPRIIERRVIVERALYYAPAAVSYNPPSPSLGQMLGGIIGVVIDEQNYRR